MKKCCQDPDNHKSYGIKASSRKREASTAAVLISYEVYLKCTVCKAPLTAKVQKTIHDRVKG